jgi:hypothetical protein
MPLIVTREAAKAAVLAELKLLGWSAHPWIAHQLFCAIEAVRRGDNVAALNHVIAARRGPLLEDRGPAGPPIALPKLRSLAERL